MTMRVLALMVAAGMLLSVLGCGLAETGAAPRRRGIFQGRRAKRGDSDATAAGYADKRWPAAAGDGDDNIRRDLAKLRAAEDAQDRRIRELRSGISEGESAVAREEEKLDAIRGRIERYEVALGERSETPSRAYRQRGRDTVGGVPAYPERGETAERWNATPYARGGMGDEAALSPPRAYDSPPRAQVRNIPDSRRQLNGGEVLVWQPPASPFAYRSGADASGSRRFPFMAAPSFPSPDRSARRPEPPAAPSYPPALPAAGVPDISQERREMGVSSPTASPAAAKRTPSPLPTWSEQETASAASPPPPFASQAEQSLRPPPPSPPSPPAPGQSLRPQVRSNVSAAPSYQYPDAGSVPVSDVFVPDLYLDGGS